MTNLTNVPDGRSGARDLSPDQKVSRRCITNRNYLYREALRPIYSFFAKQDIDEANIRMRKVPDWERMEAARDEVLELLLRAMTGVGASYGLRPSNTRMETSPWT